MTNITCEHCTPQNVHTELTPRLTVHTIRHDDDCPAIYSIEASA